jgi:protein-S-isoprenylcysteine O-methyltransferase Ste14
MAARIADVVLLLHFAIAAFVTAGFLLVPLGAALRWHWVRRRVLRLAHLGAIAFVAAEALIGVACPLTLLEDWLRGAQRGGGFVERWIGEILYWNLPPWVFTAIYAGAALLALLLWRFVPPRNAGQSP